jgi:hypothetical protein
MRAPLILLFAALSLLSCKEKPRVPPEKPATPRPAPEDAGSARERLKAFHDETVTEQAKYLSTAENIQSYRSSIAKYSREAEAIRLFERIPKRPGLDELRGAFADAVTSLGFTLRGWQAQIRPSNPPALPETAIEGPAQELSPDHLRSVIEVRVELVGAKAERLDEILARLREMPRLFYVTSVHKLPDGLALTGEAYYFRADVRPPRLIPRERSAESELVERRIDPTEFRDDAEARQWLEEIFADHHAMRIRAADYAQALALQGDLWLWASRMNFLRERQEAAGARRAEDFFPADKPDGGK